MYTQQSKLSILVPVYNLQAYIAECIHSLLDQETDFAYKIVVIDDYSRDDSWSILQTLQQQNPDRLQCYQNPRNLGLAKTMCRLMQYANSQYIAYLDGDDLALPGKLQAQVAYLDAHPQCSMVYHESEVFDSDSNKTLWHYVRDYYNHQHIPTHAGINELIQYGCFFHVGSVMMRNHPHLVHSVDQKNRIILDHPWLVRNQIYLDGNIDFIDQVLGCYRIHNSSFGARNRVSDKRKLQVLREQLHVCDLALQHGIDPWVITRGRYHYYYATALFFLKKGNRPLFNDLLEKSTDQKFFLDQKHQDIWLHRYQPEWIIKKYF